MKQWVQEWVSDELLPQISRFSPNEYVYTHLAGRSYALVTFAIPVRHPPCQKHIADQSTLDIWIIYGIENAIKTTLDFF